MSQPHLMSNRGKENRSFSEGAVCTVANVEWLCSFMTNNFLTVCSRQVTNHHTVRLLFLETFVVVCHPHYYHRNQKNVDLVPKWGQENTVFFHWFTSECFGDELRDCMLSLQFSKAKTCELTKTKREPNRFTNRTPAGNVQSLYYAGKIMATLTLSMLTNWLVSRRF